MLLLYLILAGVSVYLLSQRLRARRPAAPQKHLFPPNKCAIVIGGGMGGLLSAAILSKHFEKVIIYERDSLADASKPRKFVPQGNQVHAMLTGGARACESIFPGLLREVVDAGATTLHYGEIAVWMKHLWASRPPREPATETDLTLLSASRVLWEHLVQKVRQANFISFIHLEQRVRALRNVQIVDSTIVAGLVERDGSIIGVRLSSDSNNVEVVNGDFVVDASGRSSKIDTWLQELGYGPITSDECEAGIGYMTGVFAMPEGAFDIIPGTKASLSVPADDKTRVAMAWPIENRQYHLVFACYGKDYPPLERTQLEQWVTEVPHNEHFLKILREWPQVKDFVSYHPPTSKWRHIEQMRRWPQNLVCVGDTMAGFNPLFAQGMTQAALHALALDQVLTEQRRHRFAEGCWWVPQEYHKRAAHITKTCWDLGIDPSLLASIGTPADLARPTTVGPRTAATKFASVMGWELLNMLLSTPEGTVRFARLQQCIAPPEEVLSTPSVLFPLLLRTAKALIGQKPANAQ